MFRRTDAAACLLIVLAAAVWFSPWWGGGRNLAPFDILHEMMLPWRTDTVPQVQNHFVTDAVTQYIPYRMFGASSIAADGFVGWNPDVFGGTPQHANTMALYFDWTMHLHRFLDFWTAWNLGIFLQFVIAGVGMWWFLRRQDVPAFAALAGALAWMGNTQFIVWVYHRWALSAFCWFPLVLLAFFEWEKSRRPRWLALGAVAIALSFLGGTLQHVAMIVVGVLCCWAGSAWDLRKSVSRRQLIHFAGYAVAGLLAVGLSAWMLDATIRMYFENSAAGHERAGFGYGSGLTQPLFNLVSLAFYPFPSLAGSAQTLDLLKVFKSDLFNLGSFGTLPVLLALTALFWRGTPSAARLLMVAGLLLPLSPFVALFYHRINVLWIAGGVWAFAVFVRDAGPAVLMAWTRWSGRLAALGLGLWIAASGALIVFGPKIETALQKIVLGQAQRSQFGLFRDWMAERAGNLVDYVSLTNPLQIVSVGAIAGGWWALHAWARGQRNWVLWFLPAGVFVQSTLFWFQWTAWSDDRNPYERPPLVRLLQENLDSGRVLQIQPSSRLPDGILYNNVLDPADVPITAGYDSMHPNGMNKRAAGPLMPGTSLIMQGEELPGPEDWTLVGTADGASVWKNPGFAMAIADNGEAVAFERLSPSRITLNIPPGAQSIQIFENFHRGWRATGPANESAQLAANPDGSLQLTVKNPGQWILQFSPGPSRGILFLLFASALGVIVLFCAPRRWRMAKD
ncbi:MAG: hypothetical protein SFU53_01630 [Terrimicrobiaceae bacterium]|nr:hypothetical protein [Terrimicrobiaceae bacterium]